MLGLEGTSVGHPVQPPAKAGSPAAGHTRAEGQNHLQWTADHASIYAAQDMIGFLGFERTLLGHVQFLVNQHLQVHLRVALNPFSTQPVFALGVALTQV